MPLNIVQTYEDDFCSLIERLRGKYPPELFVLEGIHESQLDINQASREFFRTAERKGSATADHSIDPNANVSGRDVITFNYEVPKSLMKLNSLYNLWQTIKESHGKEMADKVIEGEISGAFYINDAWDLGRPYCFNFSTYDIAISGLPMAGRMHIVPPKGLSSFLRQAEQFTVTAANSTLGATGLADLLIVASWYVDRIKETGKDLHVKVASIFDDGQGADEHEVETYVSEMLISFIHTLNYEFRGNQSAFTNVSVYDDNFLRQLVPSYEINGKCPSLDTVKQVQLIYLKAMDKELERNPLTFPVTTACFSVQNGSDGSREILDKRFLNQVCEVNLKKGFINFYLGETSTLSSCCRLRSSISDLGYANTFGAGSTKIGSLGVVTLNLPRLASLNTYGDEAWDYEGFLEDLEALTTIAAVINNAKRKFIEDRIKRGALPLYTLGFMDLSRQYSTTGFTGLYEALEILGHDINTYDGMELAQEILETINETNNVMAKAFNSPHNMEQVPAESSAVKLAKKDRLMNIHQVDYDLYSNQFVPLWTDDGINLLDRIDIQGGLDSYCSGGAICHLNIENEITNIEVMKALVEHSCERGVIYFAVNYKLHKCVNNHMSVGPDGEKCPICGGEITDNYTRVVGFLTNTKHYNKVRREKDYPNRVFARCNNDLHSSVTV